MLASPLEPLALRCCEVLRGAKLSDLMAVVVRWYGGVKLGKGGLARAYSQAVHEALEELPTEERVPTVLVEIVVPYTRFGELKRLVHPPEVEIVDERYADESVRLTLEVAVGRQEWLRETLASLGAEADNPWRVGRLGCRLHLRSVKRPVGASITLGEPSNTR